MDLYDFAQLSFEPDLGLFTLSGDDGRYHLSQEVIAGDDEGQHLQRLQAVGMVLAKLVQLSHSVDIPLSNELHLGFSHYGVFGGEAWLSRELCERYRAFFRGFLDVLPPRVLYLLGPEATGRLLEWGLMSSASELRLYCEMPECDPESRGAEALEGFWGALGSFSPPLMMSIVRHFRARYTISRQALDDLSGLTLAIQLREDRCRLISSEPRFGRIQIPVLSTVDDYRISILATLLKTSPSRGPRICRLAGLTLKDRIRILDAAYTNYDAKTKIKAPRDNIFASALKDFINGSSYDDYGEAFGLNRWIVKFLAREGGTSEPGVDHGALLKEWLLQVIQGLVDPSFGVFTTDPNTKGYCHSFTSIRMSDGDDGGDDDGDVDGDGDDGDYDYDHDYDYDYDYNGDGDGDYNDDDPGLSAKLKFAGTMIAKALILRLPIRIRFPPIIYWLILHGHQDRLIYFEALQTIDPVASRRLAQVMNSDGRTIKAMHLSFEVVGPDGTARPLLENERTLRVTEDNKDQYVNLMARWLLLGPTAENAHAFVDAFHSMLPKSALQRVLLTPVEIEQALYGSEEIDIDDWERHTIYSDATFNAESPIVRWFWDILRSFGLDERQRMLQFATGTKHLPATGFVDLAPQKFTIAPRITVQSQSESQDNVRVRPFPEAKSCFNILYLPQQCDSKEELQDILEAALNADMEFGKE